MISEELIKETLDSNRKMHARLKEIGSPQKCACGTECEMWYIVDKHYINVSYFCPKCGASEADKIAFGYKKVEL